MELKSFLKLFSKLLGLIFAVTLWTACDQNRTDDTTPNNPGSSPDSGQTTSQANADVNSDTDPYGSGTEDPDESMSTDTTGERQEITGGRTTTTATATPTATPSPSR